MATYGLSEELRDRIAQELYDATQRNTTIPLLSREYPVFTLADAYAIQRKGFELNIANGAKLVGHKIGITSEGVMKALECFAPDYGYLLDYMQVPEGGSIVRSEMNLPIVEAELAFILNKNLNRGPITEEDVIDATESIAPCFEICDVRFPDWRITVRDVICDNAAAARFMVSSFGKPLSEIDPASVSITMEKNGEPLRTATGAEVMGSPIKSVAWLANKLLEYGDFLGEGDIVLSGSVMEADPAEAGDTYTIIPKGFLPLTLSFE